MGGLSSVATGFRFLRKPFAIYTERCGERFNSS